MTNIESSTTTGSTTLSRIGLLCGLLVLFPATTIAASDLDRDGLIGPVREVVERFIHWEGRAATIVRRTLYDKKGHRLEFHEWVETNGTLIPESKRKVLYQYDPPGRLIKFITYGADGSISRTMTSTYDEKGQKTGEIDRDDKGREGMRWTYSWDNRGNMKEMLVYIPDGHTLADVNAETRYTWEYDSQDHVIETMSYRSDGAFVEKILRKYDDKGRLSEQIRLESNGSVHDRIVFHYDRSGRGMEQLNHNAEGTLTSKSTYISEDDVRGNWVKKTPGRWSYDESGKPERRPTTEVITRTITYYPIGDAQK